MKRLLICAFTLLMLVSITIRAQDIKLSADETTLPSGGSWSSLGRGINYGGVQAVAVYEGQLIAGGDFVERLDGANANCIAAWNRSSWLQLDSGVRESLDSHSAVSFGKWVGALAVYNGQLVVGGKFNYAGDSVATSLAIWDGGSWSSLTNDGLWGFTYIHALTVYEGQLIVGGDFHNSLSCGHVRSIAAWNGDSWSTLDSGIRGGRPDKVLALAVYRGQLIAAGQSQTAGGVDTKNSISAWDGNSWSPLGTGINGTVRALAVYDGQLVAGGLFTEAGGTSVSNIVAWDGRSWRRLGDGLDDVVDALCVYRGQLIAGGDFGHAGETAASNIAVWNGYSWSEFGGGIGPEVEGERISQRSRVRTLLNFDGQLIVGGQFSKVGERGASNIAAWSESNVLEAKTKPKRKPVISASPSTTGYWKILGSSFDGEIKALAVYDGQLIAGGKFTSVDGTIVNHIARWNGSKWTPMGSGMHQEVVGWSCEVWALVVYNDQLIAAGWFSSAGNSEVNDIAAWDGNTWSQLGQNKASNFRALLIYDQKLIVAGAIQSTVRNESGQFDHFSYIASWDGSDWKQIGSFTRFPYFRTLSVYNGQLIAGANTDISSDQGIVTWNGRSWSPLGEWKLGYGRVHAFSVYNGQLIAGGNFNLIDTEPMKPCCHVNNAVFDGRNWSPLGKVNKECGDIILQKSLAVYDDQLIAGFALCDDPVGKLDGEPSYASIAYWSNGSWVPIGWASGEAITIYNGQLTIGGNIANDGTIYRNSVAVWSE